MSEVLHRTVQELEEIAAEKGLTAVTPLPDEIMLDLDDGATINLKVLKALEDNNWYVVSQLETISQHGNLHVYLKMNKELSTLERIAVQACLGSDPVKEVLSFIRSENHDAAVAMFETSEALDRVQKWRKKCKTMISKA